MTSRASTATSENASRKQGDKRPASTQSRASDVSQYSRTTTVVKAMRVSPPWHLSYKFDQAVVTFPKKLLFADYSCKLQLETIDMRGWTLSTPVFQIIRDECSLVRVLVLDDVVGLTNECFQSIRGLKHLRSLSLQRIQDCTITVDIAHCIASFKQLRYLNMNECETSQEVYNALSQSCANVKVLHLSKCKGLDAFCLRAIGQWIQRFRKLQVIDFSGCDEITDDGILDVCVAGFNLLVELNLSNCRCLSTTALSGLRTKMPEFRKLNISNMVMGNSIYEWMTEGCRSLTSLNMANSPELDDAGLARIGRWCRNLLHIDISECLDITDYGVAGFFKQFYGALEYIDISGCPLLGSASAVTLSKHAGALKTLKLNGLSRLEPHSLTTLWGAAQALQHFEMCSNLSTTTTHRKSSMPHFSDAVLSTAPMPAALTYVKLTGAFQVTDIGACALVRGCPQLTFLDMSYCNSISDKLVFELATHSSHLKHFIATGCILITSTGIIALSSGCCRLTLEQLEINGCAKVMDPGLTAIAALVNLHILGIRGCDYATDPAIVAIAEGCTRLKSVDMLNLDLVNATAAEAFARNCPFLTTLNCEGCAFTPKEYVAAVNKKLPFAVPAGSKCRLVPLPRTVVNYNHYVMEVKRHDVSARVIQKFGRYVVATQLLRIAKRLKRQQKGNMKRVFHAFRLGVMRSKKEGLKERHHYGAIDLQRCMRKVYAIHLARVKARGLRRERDARGNLQRVFRGFASRKRTIATFTTLYVFYNRIGHLVHKYVVIRAARRNHRRILCVQGFARMVGPLVRFRLLRWAIRFLQRRWRRYVRTHQEILRKAAEKRERIRLENIRRDKAARFLQRNWKNTFFNKSMAPFILTACIFFRVNYDEQKWHSTMIQRRWRGFIVRLKLYRKTSIFRKRHRAAALIQAMARRRIQKRRFFHLRRRMRKVNKHYRALLVNSRPRLRIGIVVKIIQKYVRRLLFIMQRIYAAIHIQRIFRGYYYRGKWMLLVYEVHTMKVNKIKRAFFLYKLRKIRKAEIARRHMAAYKIWAMVDKLFQPKRRQVAMSLARRTAFEEHTARKVELLHTKRVKIVNRIRERFHNVLATRIQHAYKKYKLRKLARLPTPSRVRRGSVAEAIANKKPSTTEALLAPVRMAKKLLHKIPSPFGNSDLIPEKDTSRFVNSVLKYQVKNILQEGLMDIHITLGELETKNFGNTQDSLRRNHMLHFVMLPQDLSGELNLLVYLWLKFGSGKDCICQLEVVGKPAGVSMAGQKIRVHGLHQQGVKVAWRQHVNFEIHGICSVLQGKGDFAIQQVKIATSTQEEDAIAADGNFTQAGDLAKHGMHTTIWTTARKPIDESNLYKFVQLATYDWFDERLKRICKGFYLTEDDVLAMWDVYKEVIAGRKVTNVRITEIFQHLDYPFSELSRWVFQSVKPDSKNDISFSEYVHMVSAFIMLGPKDLAKFLFQCADTDGRQYLTEEQFHKLIDVLGEESPFNAQGWHLQYKTYYDRKLNYFFIGNFEKMLHLNPGILWKAQAIQRKFMQYNVGIKYWEKKMEQFRVIRADLGIKLI